LDRVLIRLHHGLGRMLIMDLKDGDIQQLVSYAREKFEAERAARQVDHVQSRLPSLRASTTAVPIQGGLNFGEASQAIARTMAVHNRCAMYYPQLLGAVPAARS